MTILYYIYIYMSGIGELIAGSALLGSIASGASGVFQVARSLFSRKKKKKKQKPEIVITDANNNTDNSRRKSSTITIKNNTYNNYYNTQKE